MVDRASRVRVTGPLAAYAPAFRVRLSELGYTAASAATHMILMAQLSRWLAVKKLDPSRLTAERVAQFLSANRAVGHRFPKSARGADRLISFLRVKGVIPAAPVAMLSVSEQLVGHFGRFLLTERGLAAGTIVNHQHAARLFLASLEPVVVVDLGRLEPAQVHRFVLAQAQRRSVSSAKCIVVGLRSLLRFLHVEGITEMSLVGAVPTVSGWSGTWLPRGVDAGSVRRLLASCDRANAQGRRDYAVLMMLTRLGVRVGELAALRLDDIDWHRGEVLIRGKGQRLERLPLPVDVGRALATYVHKARPRSEHRQLFLRVLAPHRGLTAGALIMIVQSACRHAGLDPIAAHRLRHTVASDLLRAGAGLPEIGQLLRHRSFASTAIYAKVDTVALRALARPWPGGLA
jgi:integrase/recombinase XerD